MRWELMRPSTNGGQSAHSLLMDTPPLDEHTSTPCCFCCCACACDMLARGALAADAKLRCHQYDVKGAVTAVNSLLGACEASLARLASQAPPVEGTTCVCERTRGARGHVCALERWCWCC